MCWAMGQLLGETILVSYEITLNTVLIEKLLRGEGVMKQLVGI